MALFNHIKTSGQMDPVELEKSEALYQLYMEGEKKRIPGLHIGVDFGSAFQTMILALKKMKDQFMIIDVGGILSGRTAGIYNFMNGSNIEYKSISREDLYTKPKFPLGFHSPVIFSGVHDAFEQMKEVSSMASKEVDWLKMESEKIQRLEDYDEPVNFCHGEHPPKKKKFRSYVPDKRMINRRNRKSKRK